MRQRWLKEGRIQLSLPLPPHWIRQKVNRLSHMFNTNLTYVKHIWNICLTHVKHMLNKGHVLHIYFTHVFNTCIKHMLNI